MWQGRRHVSFFSQTREPGHSWPMPVLLLCGAGAACGGVATGLGELAGGSTACDGGALRCCAGGTCGVAALGSGLDCAGGWPTCDGGALRWPKFGFCALQSATSCRSIFGKGLLARGGCRVCRMIGAMQSTKRPSPVLAPPCTNPACSQAALIAAQACWRGAACTETAGPKPTINVPKMTGQIRFRCIFIAPGGCQLSQSGDRLTHRAEFSE